MDTDIIDHLKTLYTSEIDARNGYEEALEDAEGKGLTSLFRDMIALHHGNAEELAGMLINAGETADDSGSFMSVVHRTIMSVRSLFDGLDGSVLPGLIDGEKRNLSKYDDALKAIAGIPSISSTLSAQRAKISEKIALMEQQKAAYEAAT
ncbi:ferritin-like domain-containing protein [Rhodopseudomonas palustris]|uniref:ferritin-like domain-containing protein n=1 Tax=Rhodopseudomonas palustris TaxID=1076 RepID=UPI000E5B315C|nr:PA2169 family four-helix-bundle protein [Rhodopseudomonas palustris]QLH70602.1 PA2169 family four-helix-bundle protein [Rhodopseudomonas palustris]RHZ96656.1 PA2169 family four-helix-bundle protein [Rhodopseudomonas palustris]